MTQSPTQPPRTYRLHALLTWRQQLKKEAELQLARALSDESQAEQRVRAQQQVVDNVTTKHQAVVAQDQQMRQSAHPAHVAASGERWVRRHEQSVADATHQLQRDVAHRSATQASVTTARQHLAYATQRLRAVEQHYEAWRQAQRIADETRQELAAQDVISAKPPV